MEKPEASKSQHILTLVTELLDDIELSRLDAERLLLKCSRLARLSGSDEIKSWIAFELRGYNNKDPIAVKYIGLTGRWTDRENKKGYFGPLAQQQAALAAQKAKLAGMKTPDNPGEFAIAAIRAAAGEMSSTAAQISRLSGIQSKVLALLHKFVSQVYYEKQFDSLSESIFEEYKSEVDTRIAETCGDVLEKIPAVMNRLADGDDESISQALTTCRRIIEAFADTIYPPAEGEYDLGDGNKLKLDAGKYLNRINIYVHERTKSKSRRKRIRDNIKNLYDRACAGVHNEVTQEEAMAIFLNTYLFLGEVLHLAEPASAAPAEVEAAAT